MTADNSGPELVPDVVLVDGGVLERNLAVFGDSAFDFKFAEAQRLLHRFDARRVPELHRNLKTRALERGWLVPSGLNDEWRLNKHWQQYYDGKLKGAYPPVERSDECLIAEARSRGISTPLATALNDKWRLYLKLKIAEDVILNRMTRRTARGKTPGSWNKAQPRTQDEEVVKRRTKRQSKATTTKY
jgi:hypothetical protein